MSDVVTHRRQAVLEVVFSRPERKNAITFAAYDALHQACEEVDRDPTIRVMVIRGSGDSFAAGTDIRELQEFVEEYGGRDYEDRVERVLSRLERVRVPVLAAIHGVAAGAGLLVAACSDLCICTPDSRFGAPVARTLGNPISIRNLARLERALGARRARAVLMTAQFLNAEQAHQAGFVTEVVPSASLDERVDAIAGRITDLAPLAIEAFKIGLTRLETFDPESHPTDDDLVERCYESEDFKEGVSSFLEHRKPVFRRT